jgi:hypothetical protein
VEAGAIFVHDDHDLALYCRREFGLTLDPQENRHLIGEYLTQGRRIRADGSSSGRSGNFSTSEACRQCRKALYVELQGFGGS